MAVDGLTVTPAGGQRLPTPGGKGRPRRAVPTWSGQHGERVFEVIDDGLQKLRA